MKLWKKFKSNPSLTKKGRFDQIWPNRKLNLSQKKKFRSVHSFFSPELKKTVSLNFKQKALALYFYSNGTLAQRKLTPLLSPKIIKPITKRFSIKVDNPFHSHISCLPSLSQERKGVISKTNYVPNHFKNIKFDSQVRPFSILENRSPSTDFQTSKLSRLAVLKKRNNILKRVSLSQKKLNFAQFKKAILYDLLSFKSAFLAPGVLRLRKLKWSYSLKLKSLNKVRILYGNLSHNQIKKLFKKAQVIAQNQKIWNFILTLETLPSILWLKSGFGVNICQAKHLANHSKYSINGEAPSSSALLIQPGDLILNFKSSIEINKIDREKDSFQSSLSANDSFSWGLSKFSRIFFNLLRHRLFIRKPTTVNTRKFSRSHASYKRAVPFAGSSYPVKKSKSRDSSMKAIKPSYLIKTQSHAVNPFQKKIDRIFIGL